MAQLGRIGHHHQTMDDPVETAAALARRVAALPDADMRVAYVRHELRRHPPELVVDIVAIAANLTESKIPPNQELLLAISLALADEVADDLRLAALGVAASRGQRDVVMLLSRRSIGDDDTPDDKLVPDFGRGRPLTLGERKSLARTRDRDLLMRVLRDPHPDVITILLGNPMLTEENIVRLAARRPIAPSILRLVFRSTRWIVRYRVRRVLCLNPNTPLDVSLALVRHLTDSDRRLVFSSTELPDEVRRASEVRAPPLLH